MRDLKKQERAAIEAVARRFSATWEMGTDPRDVYFMVAGKRVAVDITTLKRRGTGQGNAAKQVTETALRILVGMPFPRSTVICA